MYGKSQRQVKEIPSIEIRKYFKNNFHNSHWKEFTIYKKSFIHLHHEVKE